jgi:CubicO group peptidase (beta-lactamase class C family)
MNELLRRFCAIVILFLVNVGTSNSQDLARKMDTLLNAYANQFKFSGVAFVTKEGKVLLQKGYGYKNFAKKIPNDPGGVFQIGSVTKQFTAAVILRLQEQGKLNVQDKLRKYISDFPGSDRITVEHLLTHTSGIYNYTNDNRFMNNESLKHVELDRMISMMKEKPLEFTPGSKFSYSNSNYILLGYIIQRVSGKPYEQMVRELIFTPLQMNQSGFDFKNLKDTDKVVGYLVIENTLQLLAPIVDSSASFAAGAIYSSAGDLYKWHMALYTDKVLSKASIEKAFTPKLNKYGYGWMIDSIKGKRIIRHNGGIFGFTSDMVRIPADDVCIILLCNEAAELSSLSRALTNIMYGLPYSVPEEKKSVQLPEDVLKTYVGEYWVSEDYKVNITLENGQLKAQVTGQPKVDLYAQKTDLFFVKIVDAQVEFKKDSTGKVQKLIFYQGGAMVEAVKVK